MVADLAPRVRLIAALCCVATASALSAGCSASSEPRPCVIGLADGGSAERFLVGDDVVTDVSTGLEWQQDHAPDRNPSAPGNQAYSWAEAQAFCASATTGSRSGWRLPTLPELEALADASRRPAICGSAFPDTPPQWFWTATPTGDDTTFSVLFKDGSVGFWDPSLSCRVRCVR